MRGAQVFSMFILLFANTSVLAKLYQVGPGQAYGSPSEVAALVQDGDEVAIAAGDYVGDVAVWRANDLLLRGVGGYAVLIAAGRHAEGKGIWVIKGRNTRVEQIEFRDAMVPDGNGAGLRQEGENLTIDRCRFIRNQNGLLSGPNPNSEIVVSNSEFAYNGSGTGYTHNIYIGAIKTFTLRNSFSHHAHIGHQVKSRARENYILYNHLADGQDGDSSYLLDLPEGGLSFVIGNVLQQGPRTENPSLLAYASESKSAPSQQLLLVNNTFVNLRAHGVFVKYRDNTDIHLWNNLLVGKAAALPIATPVAGNVLLEKASFINADALDYRLPANSPVIDAGVTPVAWQGKSLLPEYEYRFGADMPIRSMYGKPDAGAFEFVPAL